MRLIINGIIISFFILCLSSCSPLVLKPIQNNIEVQKIEESNLSKFNGNYKIFTTDSKTYSPLDYTFTYLRIFDWKKFPTSKDYINLKAIDSKHIKATLYVNDSIIKTKTIKGNLVNNYFEFSTSHLSMKYVFFSYQEQTNRIALSKEGDLYLDTYCGGVGFFLFIVIPLSGGSWDTYNLKYERRN